MRRDLSIRTVHRRRELRTWRLAASFVAVAALAWISFSSQTAGALQEAHATRVLRSSDMAKLHYIESKSSGSHLFEEGSASGTLPGSMHVYANIGPTLTATFTIFTHGGTIVGRASATPHGSGRYESFAGSLVATGGSGSFAHAHGRAGFYGVLNRLTYGMVVQTTGTLLY
jgi:hypothetical protein